MSTIKPDSTCPPRPSNWSTARRLASGWLLLLLVWQCGLAQQRPGGQGRTQTPAAAPTPAAETPADALRPTYTLGPNDQVMIRAQDADEISDKPYRVEGDGSINLPMVGKMQAGGLTVAELESQLVDRLRTYIRNPQVIVTVVQFRSDPIFLIGAFRTPGIHALQGRRTLIEMLSGVGGLTTTASRRIKITRRLDYGVLPLPNVIEDPESRLSSAEISLSSLMETVNPAADIQLMPFDILKAGTAELVYVTGEVMRTGTVELQDREYLSAAQAIAMSGGLSPFAQPEKAHVLRPVLDTARRAEITVDLRKILAGEANDFPLLPNDVLYVPRSRSRAASIGRNLLVVVPVVTAVSVIFIRR